MLATRRNFSCGGCTPLHNGYNILNLCTPDRARRNGGGGEDEGGRNVQFELHKRMKCSKVGCLLLSASLFLSTLSLFISWGCQRPARFHTSIIKLLFLFCWF